MCLLPCFLSLSSIIPDSSLSLSFSRPLQRRAPLQNKKIPIIRTYSIHSSKKTSSKTHSKKNPKSKPFKLNQQEHDKTQKKKKKKRKEKRDPLKKKREHNNLSSAIARRFDNPQPHHLVPLDLCPCKQEIPTS